MFIKVSNLNSNLALTQGYLNLALNNSAQVFRKFYRFPVYNVKRQLIMPYIDQNFLWNLKSQILFRCHVQTFSLFSWGP